MMLEPLVFHHDRKTTLAGLREAFNAVPPAPPAMSFAEYSALSSRDRDAYDQARHDFMHLTLRVRTPEQELSAQRLTRLLASNPRRPNSRRGLMISGPMFHGKTELAMWLGRSVEQKHAACHPLYKDNGEVPVVWVEMTDHATGKALLSQIINFLAPTAVVPTRATTEELRRRTVDLLHAHRTKMLVIDEAHTLGGSEPSSVIKSLQNESSATVVLVGIDLGGGRAFGKGDGLQVTTRCDIITVRKVDADTESGRALWKRWVAIFDRNLPLCDHDPGMLTHNAPALQRAAGGHLARLALIIERLLASILDDPTRRDEKVTPQRLFETLDNLGRTTPMLKNIKLEDLSEAA
ncbi:TniB family NTP-binding protein [Pseudoclavibacter helvolus]|uniref:TniB family NTP-binding protein n=1 Tax=Pseudoclavibacter helvolus TaxID=255205 RepID=UPI0024AD76C1|nr:TniB family NTP-binding protein [Pseudoclavibacter helvolus]